jgi:hypothetical protein
MKGYRRPSEPRALVIARHADCTRHSHAFALIVLTSAIGLWLSSL